MIRIISKFRKILNRHQTGRIVILFLMMIVAAGFNVVGVGMMIPLVSTILNENIINSNPIAGWIADTFHIDSNIGFIILCISAIIIIYIMKDLYCILEVHVQNRFLFYNRYATQSKVLQSYMLRPYEFFLHVSSGEMVRVIQQDIVNIFNLLGTILYFFSELIIAVALIIAVFIINPLITTIISIAMGLMILIIVRGVKPNLRKAGTVLNDSTASTNKWLLQALAGIKEIKISKSESFFHDKFNYNAKKTAESSMKYTVWSAIPQLLLELVSVGSVLIAIMIELIHGIDINVLITQLSAFVMAASRLLPAANRVVNAASNIAYYEPALDKVLSILNNSSEEDNLILTDLKKEWDKRKKSLQPLTIHEKIGLKEIYYSYPDSEIEILSGASIEIPIGKSVGIIGTSGSGKTTSVDILLGLLVPQKGQVYADGIDVMTNYDSWLSHIGYIPQSIFMLDDTIRENVIFGKNDDKSDDLRVWNALEEAQLADFVHSLPEGLNTEIGEKGVRLSGGQRQRIGIARALYKSPDILVFDEATSALDNETESAIMKSINALHGKKTLIIIAHRLTTIEGCDLVYKVESGKIERA